MIPVIIIGRSPLSLNIGTNGSSLQMTNAAPTPANITLNPRKMYGISPSTYFKESGTLTGKRIIKSWIVPSGQTAAQKTLPNNNENTSGRMKKATADSGSTYWLSTSHNVTF